MVSRSMEKMMLIAIGLTTVVIVGVPILAYTIETFSNISSFESAQTFAERVHNLTATVDGGNETELSVEIRVPKYVEITSSNNILSIAYVKEGIQDGFWSDSYLHEIVLIPPSDSGIYTLTVELVADQILVTFTSI